MSSFAYYNEFDPFAAAWLTALIADGLIPDGAVDTRSIVDVEPSDLDGFTQHHFFAGIGGWPWALRLAGWPDDRPVWTGSCPCQPFSNAGGRAGDKDDRHLWPHFYRLISQCGPARVFGEQVSSPLGRQWLASVRADMEALGYAVGVADLCAASVGAPHNRSRLWFGAVLTSDMAHTENSERGRRQRGEEQSYGHGADIERRSSASDMADLRNDRRQGRVPGRTDTEREDLDRQARRGSSTHSAVGVTNDRGRPSRSICLSEEEGKKSSRRPVAGSSKWRNDMQTVGDTRVDGTGQHSGKLHGDEAQHEVGGTHGYHPPLTPSAAGSYSQWWRDCEWLPCRDGVYRPVEPGTFPLAAGIPGRVGLLRGYGNSIVPAVAQAWIEAFEETVQALKGGRT